MKKNIDLTVKRKIFLSCFLIVFLFLLGGLYFILPINKIRSAAREIELGSFAEIELVTSLETSISNLNHLLFISEHITAEGDWAKLRKNLAVEIEKFKVVLSEYKRLVKSKPHYRQNILLLENVFNEYKDVLEKKSADNSGAGGFLYPEEAIIFAGLTRNLRELRDEAIAVLSSDLGSIDYLGKRLIVIYFLLIIFISAASFLIAFNLSMNIASPIKELVLAHQQIGKGDLDYKINIKRKDEFGILQEGVMIMAQRLKYLSADLYRQKDILADEVKERTKDFEQTKRYLEEITNGIDEEIILLDQDYRILWMNKKVMDKIGLQSKDIIGQFCFKISHHNDIPCPEHHVNNACPVKELLKTKEPVTVVHSHYDKHGNLFYAEISVYPLKNEQGEINQFIHISRDITKRIEMESELNRSVQEMKEKIIELELFHKVTIGRELKMVELKECIVELEQKLKEK